MPGKYTICDECGSPVVADARARYVAIGMALYECCGHLRQCRSADLFDSVDDAMRYISHPVPPALPIGSLVYHSELRVVLPVIPLCGPPKAGTICLKNGQDGLVLLDSDRRLSWTGYSPDPNANW